MTGLAAQPLTPEAFRPYGQVIAADAAAETVEINRGFATRYHALATAAPGPDGRAVLSIFRARRRPGPLVVDLLERHPLGSQAFMPLQPHDWLVVVADTPAPGGLRAFRAQGDQGVQIAPGIWHAPLIVLAAVQDFLVVDRAGPGQNLDEVALDPPVTLVL